MTWGYIENKYDKEEKTNNTCEKVLFVFPGKNILRKNLNIK